MKAVFHASALADLQNIHDYIAKENPTVAVTVIARIKTSLDRLREFPKFGTNRRRARNPGGRGAQSPIHRGL